MKRNYTGLWVLLAVAFVAFAAVSALNGLKIGPLEIKSSGIAERLTHEPEQAPDPVTAIDSIALGLVPTAPEPAPIDSAAKTLMIIGDSMLEGLSPRLADYAEANGHTLYTVIWYSSTSAVWGKCERLREYLDKINPDFVFLSLGSNELFVSDIKNKRRGFVEKIISDLGDTPYVWIGPPNWKDDTGINELVEETAAAGCYFRSAGMHFDRAKDGAHPTRKSAALWMDSIASWLPEHSPHPFLMDNPGETKGKPKRIFVHQPNE